MWKGIFTYKHFHCESEHDVLVGAERWVAGHVVRGCFKVADNDTVDHQSLRMSASLLYE